MGTYLYWHSYCFICPLYMTCNASQCTGFFLNEISIEKWFFRHALSTLKHPQPLFRDGAVYFFPLRFCSMTSLALFHLCVDGFQAGVLLCPHPSPPFDFGEGKEKVAVKATPMPSLQPHRSISKMRSDDTRAPGALLSLSFSVSPHTQSYWRCCALKGGKSTDTVMLKG